MKLSGVEVYDGRISDARDYEDGVINHFHLYLVWVSQVTLYQKSRIKKYKYKKKRKKGPSWMDGSFSLWLSTIV